MSIQSEIERIDNNVQSTLSVIADTGVSVASDANSDALPAAAAALANEKANVEHTHVMADITDFSGGGGSGVYVGEDEPTDDSVVVWINPGGDTIEAITVARIREICT